LLSAEGVERLVAELLPVVGWVTPNLDEAAGLLGERVAGRAGIPEQAYRLAELGGSGLNVVVTGGFWSRRNDFLRTVSGEERWFPGKTDRGPVDPRNGMRVFVGAAVPAAAGDGPVEAWRERRPGWCGDWRGKGTPSDQRDRWLDFMPRGSDPAGPLFLEGVNDPEIARSGTAQAMRKAFPTPVSC